MVVPVPPAGVYINESVYKLLSNNISPILSILKNANGIPNTVSIGLLAFSA